ncbi:nucleotide exchange factor GrpE [Pseudoruegeria sp. SHC-113]|uniref:nucleotide exchange factor GrpE n=1 Tax=Pseudoruegeria sp. SHC-113 TaxID=2855439 RepID=UPI0021BABF12|nr:nucleotide exchange factor GrpE [Pseudoruegeria sp. SHC-113]MCT8158568.1 nucleotide exchange factor GrpE [Pseudoruegeria sp. SHC-113]
MAEPKQENDFLDDIEALEDELFGDEPIDIMSEEASEGPSKPASKASESEMAALRAERDELKDRVMRVLAEAENSRKRSERDRKEAENYGGSKLARDMLPVYDNLNRAIEAVPEESREANKALIEGVELTLRELLNIFSKHGIERVSPELGEKFDPKQHQAMFEAPVPGTQAGDIIQVMAEGFMIHDRLLRPAQVGVSSTPKS